MILDIADSVNGVPIRLTDERWDHIIVSARIEQHLDKATILWRRENQEE